MAADRELEGFEELAALLSSGPSDVIDETPPPGLWERILADLDAEAVADDAAGGRRAGRGGGDASGGRKAPGSILRSTPNVVVPIEEARRRRRGPITAAIVGIAAALLLVALPLGLAVRSSPSEPDAFATLDPLGSFTGDGWAELDGRELTVAVEGLIPTDDAFYELWLLDLDGSELRDLVSLGAIGEDGTFEVPEGIDLDRFRVVDISIEPDDGDPTHSGDSILQGELA
ncbi:MAG: anti-sigma factor [Acidimicrobiales bacterium]